MLLYECTTFQKLITSNRSLKVGLHRQLFMRDFMQLITIKQKVSLSCKYKCLCDFLQLHPATYCNLVRPATYLGSRSYFATKRSCSRSQHSRAVDGSCQQHLGLRKGLAIASLNIVIGLRGRLD